MRAEAKAQRNGSQFVCDIYNAKRLAKQTLDLVG